MHILPLREGWRDGEQVGREHQTQGGAADPRAWRWLRDRVGGDEGDFSARLGM